MCVCGGGGGCPGSSKHWEKVPVCVGVGSRSQVKGRLEVGGAQRLGIVDFCCCNWGKT